MVSAVWGPIPAFDCIGKCAQEGKLGIGKGHVSSFVDGVIWLEILERGILRLW